MHLEALKIFCDVVRWASFSRGAAENGVSQSSASQAVQQLESRLGVKLIDRSKRPLVLTPHGKVYYEGCKELVGRYFEVENRVQDARRGAEGGGDGPGGVDLLGGPPPHDARMCGPSANVIPGPTSAWSTCIRPASSRA